MSQVACVYLGWQGCLSNQLRRSQKDLTPDADTYTLRVDEHPSQSAVQHWHCYRSNAWHNSTVAFKRLLESSHCVSWRARREVRPSIHMPRKLSFGCAAQMAIQSASHAFQCAPPCFTCCVGSRTASHPAACRKQANNVKMYEPARNSCWAALPRWPSSKPAMHSSTPRPASPAAWAAGLPATLQPTGKAKHAVSVVSKCPIPC